MNTVGQSKPTGSILVLTDFSNGAKNAADYAKDLAQKVHANMILFHAYLIPDVGFDSWPSSDEGSLLKQSQLKLAEETTRLCHNFKNPEGAFKPEIVAMSIEGSIAENVIAIIKDKQDVLMVIMGGGKANGKQDMRFGIAITEVLNNVKCPTLIVPQAEYLTF